MSCDWTQCRNSVDTVEILDFRKVLYFSNTRATISFSGRTQLHTFNIVKLSVSQSVSYGGLLVRKYTTVYSIKSIQIKYFTRAKTALTVTTFYTNKTGNLSTT